MAMARAAGPARQLDRGVQDRKRVAADLKPVYRATNAEAAPDAPETFDDRWGAKCPMIAGLVARAGSTSSRSSRSRPTCAAPYTPTASRTSTARDPRKRPRRTGRHQLICLAIQRCERKGARRTTGPACSAASRSTSETDSPIDKTTVASPSDTERRTPSSSATVGVSVVGPPAPVPERTKPTTRPGQTRDSGVHSHAGTPTLGT
jgi:hypothetical protein